MKYKLLNAQHLSLSQQAGLLSEFVESIDGIPLILDTISDLPDAWVGAGIIFQNVWNVMHGYDINTHIKDIDIFYWDDNLSWQAEDNTVNHLNAALAGINITIDVKNIARVHVWYEERFGISKAPYGSIQESVASWPVIGACLAMRRQSGTLEFIAPYGFQDMFTMRIRPNKVLVNQSIYEDKALRWKEQWPLLSLEHW